MTVRILVVDDNAINLKLASDLLESEGYKVERAVDAFQALEIINNWRAAHSFPLNTIQVGLRRRARDVDDHALIAQRLKRVPSILQKLRRFPHMKLSRMQDIGGCRAVVDTSAEARKVHLEYAKSRPQGRPIGPGGKDASKPQVRIIEHADVKRMLLAQKSYCEGALALELHCAKLVDDLHTGDDEQAAEDQHPDERADALRRGAQNDSSAIARQVSSRAATTPSQAPIFGSS